MQTKDKSNARKKKADVLMFHLNREIALKYEYISKIRNAIDIRSIRGPDCCERAVMHCVIGIQRIRCVVFNPCGAAG